MMEDVRSFELRIVDRDRTCAAHVPRLAGTPAPTTHRARVGLLSHNINERLHGWPSPDGPPSNCVGCCVTTPVRAECGPLQLLAIDLHQAGHCYRLLQ